MRRIETKHTVIKYQIYPSGKILVTNSRMPKKCIDFITRRTSQQTKLNAICLRYSFPIIRYFSPNPHWREKTTYQDHPTQ